MELEPAAIGNLGMWGGCCFCGNIRAFWAVYFVFVQILDGIFWRDCGYLSPLGFTERERFGEWGLRSVNEAGTNSYSL